MTETDPGRKGSMTAEAASQVAQGDNTEGGQQEKSVRGLRKITTLFDRSRGRQQTETKDSKGTRTATPRHGLLTAGFGDIADIANQGYVDYDRPGRVSFTGQVAPRKRGQ